MLASSPAAPRPTNARVCTRTSSTSPLIASVFARNASDAGSTAERRTGMRPIIAGSDLCRGIARAPPHRRRLCEFGQAPADAIGLGLGERDQRHHLGDV